MSEWTPERIANLESPEVLRAFVLEASKIIESQRAELEAADRMHRYVDWHIRRQTQNSYSLLRKSLDEYAAARAGENAGCYDPWGLERSE